MWDDKYSVQVPSLDAQHKKFFEITNEILQVVDKPKTLEFNKQLTLLIVRLGNYALNHLSYEEGCIKKYRCPGCENHPEAHDVYREKIEEYLKSVRNPNIDITILAKEVAEFSQNWLSKHILNKDREYVGCLSQHDMS